MEEMMHGSLWLNLLNGPRQKVRCKTRNVDGHRKHQEVDKVVYEFVCLARLHSSEKRDDHRSEVLPQLVPAYMASV